MDQMTAPIRTRLLKVPLALQSGLENALRDCGCLTLDDGPIDVQVLCLDGSAAALEHVRKYSGESQRVPFATLLVIANEIAAGQLGALDIPSCWAWLPWPIPAGWLQPVLQCTLQRTAASTNRLNGQLQQALTSAGMLTWEYRAADCRRHIVDNGLFPLEPGQRLTLEHLIHPADLAGDQARLAEALATGRHYRNQVRVSHPETGERWLQLSADPQPLKSGEFLLAGQGVDVSLRRQLDEELADARALLFDSLHAGQMYCWQWNLVDGRRASIGPSREILGLTLNSTAAARSLLHPDDVVDYDQCWQMALQRKTGFRHEFRIVRPDGAIRWIHSRGTPVIGADGCITRMSGVAIDVTEQRQAAAALTEIRQRLELALETATQAKLELSVAQGRLKRALAAAKMVCWDWLTEQPGNPDLVTTAYSPKVAAITGVGEASVHPEDQAMHRQAIADALTGAKGEYHCEFRLLRDDGSVTWLLSLGSQLRDARGKVIGLTGVAIDVGSRKAMEVELAERREWQRLAVAAGELNLWQVDLSTGERRGGDFDQQVFGFVPANLKQVEALIHPDDRDRVNAAWELSAQTGTAYCLDYRILPDAKTTRWLQVRGQRIHSGTGSLQMVGVTRDISEQVLAEAELRDAVSRAKAASAAKSAFLASISHELRTPLNAVIGFSGLLARSVADHGALAQLQALDRAAQQLFNLINDVLDFSRIEAGEMSLEATAFAPLECLEQALEIVAAAAESKGLCLLMTATGVLDRALTGDPTRLGQVVSNLLSNAVKFCPSGTVTLALEVCREDSLGVVRIRVSDTGIGMTEAEREQLFQPFRQADVSTTRRYGGTGLGLSICKRLLDLMNGTIGVRSVPGQGSCFEVELRLPFAAAQGSTRPQFAAVRVGVAVAHPAMREALLLQLCEAGIIASVIEPATLSGQMQPATADLDVLIVQEQVIAGSQLNPAQWISRDNRPLPLIVLVGLERTLAPWSAGHTRIDLDQALRPSELWRALAQALGGHRMPAAVPAPELPAERRFSHLRVLVAEDNELNQILVMLQLQSLGISAKLVANGKAVLQTLRQERFDVILMDVEMPEIDGLEATARIRRELTQPRPYVIALTAHVLSDSQDRFIGAGMDDFISKPLLMDKLERALERALAVVGADS